MNKLKLIILLAVLVEVFLFKGENFTSFGMWIGEVLGKILGDAIMKGLMENLNN